MGAQPSVWWWAWSYDGPAESAVGRAGCGVEESEDKLEPAGTSMSAVRPMTSESNGC